MKGLCPECEMMHKADESCPITFAETLDRVETASCDEYEAQTRFQKGAEKLFKLYKAGKGTSEQRYIAVDYLEDAGLIEHRSAREGTDF